MVEAGKSIYIRFAYFFSYSLNIKHSDQGGFANTLKASTMVRLQLSIRRKHDEYG